MIAQNALGLASDALKKRVLWRAAPVAAGYNLPMLATLQRHKLQVSCESRTAPASTAHVFDATWFTKIAPQPRHFGLSLTSGPGAIWRHISAQGNKLGQYHCNHRRYDIKQGRWISPDQASSPWFGLFDYCGGRYLAVTDPIGLWAIHDWVQKHIAEPIRKKADGLRKWVDKEVGEPLRDVAKEMRKEADKQVAEPMREKVCEMKAAIEDIKNLPEKLGSYGNYCGPGNKPGDPINDTDRCCKHHDECFGKAGIDAAAYMGGTLKGQQALAACECNKELQKCLKARRDDGGASPCGVGELTYNALASGWFAFYDAHYEYCNVDKPSSEPSRGTLPSPPTPATPTKIEDGRYPDGSKYHAPEGQDGSDRRGVAPPNDLSGPK